MTTPEVFALAIGIPLEEQDQIWATIGNSMFDEGRLKKQIKRTQKDFRLAIAAENSGDREKFIRIMDDIGSELQMWSPGERDRIWFALRKDPSLPEAVMLRMLKNGNAALAIEIQETFKDG
jgi:hypothetical protein